MSIEIHHKRWLIACWFVCLACFGLQANSDTGRPLYRNIAPNEYKAHGQNFAAIQDQRGVLYVANTAGILEFDGRSWRQIPTAAGTMVRSLAQGRSGRIYVGTRGEIGYLSATENGQTDFVSLNPLIPAESSSFREVFKILPGVNETHFFAADRLFTWKDSSISVITPPAPITMAWELGECVFVQLEGKGIFCVEEGGLLERDIRLTGANWDDFVIRFVLPGKGDRFLVGTQRHGLFVWEGSRMRPMKTTAKTFLEEGLINSGLLLPDGGLVIGTEYNGILVLDQEGRFRTIINQQSGLLDPSVNHLFLDREDGVWACLNNGLSRLDLTNHLSTYGPNEGLNGELFDVMRYKGQFYAATSLGLYKLVQGAPGTDGPLTNRFEEVQGIGWATYQLQVINGWLYMATAGGVLAFDGSSVRTLSDRYTFSLSPVPGTSNRFLAGGLNGIALAEEVGGKWQDIHRWNNIASEVTQFLKGADGTMWAETMAHGVLLLNQDNLNGIGEPLSLDTASGLPSVFRNKIFQGSKDVLISTADGIVSWQADSGHVLPADLGWSGREKAWWGKVIRVGKGYMAVSGDEKGIVWYRADQADSLVLDEAVFAPIRDFPVRMVREESNGHIWLGGPDGLVLFEPARQKNALAEFDCLLRNIWLRNDSVYFGGLSVSETGSPIPFNHPLLGPEFSPATNYVRFAFSAPSFDGMGQTEYRFQLEGFDRDWSPWGKLTQKEYTNLDAGQYQFRVQARSVYGAESRESAFTFSILTPWYAQWWAFVLYGAALIGVMFLAGRIRSDQLEREKRQLEKVIEERTAEVVDQKEEIESQTEVLAIKNKELEKINQMVKSVNSGIDFGIVLQTILEETRIIKGVERAAGFVFNKTQDIYEVRAHFGWDPAVSKTTLLREDADKLFVHSGLKVGEDIFFRNTPVRQQIVEINPALAKSRAMLVLVIRIEEDTEGFLVLENTYKSDAFKEQDFELIGSFKEHIASAFIKARIMDNLQDTLTNLRDTQAKLVSQEKMAGLGQLTAGIAHEINNPINFVSGNIKPLRRDIADIKEVLELYSEIKDADTLDDKLEEIEELKDDIDLDYVMGELDDLINDIENGANRTAEIVRELRDFSRLDEDNVKMANIEEGLDSTLKILRNKYKDRLDIVKNYGGIPVIECFPGKLNQVFMNILTNAMQAIPDKGTIEITTKDLGEEISVAIKDNGSGMTEETRKKIYDPFYTTKDVGEGTGLGMSISYGIIKDHNGRIDLESELGVGTTFSIFLPKQQEKEDES